MQDETGSNRMPYCPSARIQPWIGQSYASAGLDGLRLLIVGESHYDRVPGETADAELPEVTRGVVEYAIEHDDLQFYKRVQRAISGRALQSYDEREAFWNSVAFCNLVQRVMRGRQERPTEQDYEDAKPIFFDILAMLQPHAVLVVGQDAWNGLGDMHGAVSLTYSIHRGSWTRIWRSERFPQVLATHTVHPSYYGAAMQFESPFWQTRVVEFLDEARAWAARYPLPIAATRVRTDGDDSSLTDPAYPRRGEQVVIPTFLQDGALISMHRNEDGAVYLQPIDEWPKPVSSAGMFRVQRENPKKFKLVPYEYDTI